MGGGDYNICHIHGERILRQTNHFFTRIVYTNYSLRDVAHPSNCFEIWIFGSLSSALHGTCK
jgi:hypothetical protein